eukprot:316534-Prymnesium_polylepis.1
MSAAFSGSDGLASGAAGLRKKRSSSFLIRDLISSYRLSASKVSWGLLRAVTPPRDAPMRCVSSSTN